MKHQHLAPGQDAEFVGADKKIHKGKITQVLGEHAARIEWKDGSAVAEFSDKGEPGTFNFPAATASAKAETTKEAK